MACPVDRSRGAFHVATVASDRANIYGLSIYGSRAREEEGGVRSRGGGSRRPSTTGGSWGRATCCCCCCRRLEGVTDSISCLDSPRLASLCFNCFRWQKLRIRSVCHLKYFVYQIEYLMIFEPNPLGQQVAKGMPRACGSMFVNSINFN